MKLSDFQKRLGFKISKQLLFEYIKRFSLKFEKDEVGDNIYTDQHIILFRLIWGLTHSIKLKDPEIRLILDSITIGLYKQRIGIDVNPQELYRDNLQLRQALVNVEEERDHLDRDIKSMLNEILSRLKETPISKKPSGFFRK